MLWCFIALIVVNFLIVCFYFREDEQRPNGSQILSTLNKLKEGMVTVWFRFRPAIFVIPITVALFMYVLCYGGCKLLLPIYLQAPPYSLTNNEYGAGFGIRGSHN